MMMRQYFYNRAHPDRGCNWGRLAGFQRYPRIAVCDRVFWVCEQERCAVTTSDVNNNVIGGAPNQEYAEGPTRPVTPDILAPAGMAANAGRRDDEDDDNGNGDRPRNSFSDIVKEFLFIIKWIFCILAIMLILEGFAFRSYEKANMGGKKNGTGSE
ncbi:unnamed protein product [Acanthoscelides obtectus]|uniref:Uncharacterized protein n=1 Tax=Acanthoscelides obtectus TaxID=200917 RepID=A0A9P0KBW6_ACAOB|nr:unnamed protein product [Acanthoscelides obtectus]CAK1628092.1 hypothetical protein AOBTE_LOCUS5024 [Acanthoscelides obtectus]